MEAGGMGMGLPCLPPWPASRHLGLQQEATVVWALGRGEQGISASPAPGPALTAKVVHSLRAIIAFVEESRKPLSL